MPLSAARPRCSRLTIAPVPDFANSRSPGRGRAGDAERVLHRCRRRTSEAARPRPRRRTARWCPARESRGPRCCAWSPARPGSSVSAPATTASISARPPKPRSCATASAGIAMVAPGCTPVLGHVRLSISKACASAPLANAAIGACSARPPGCSTRLLPPAPRFFRVAQDHPAPRQVRAEGDGRDGVGDGVLGALHDRDRGRSRIAQVRGVFGQRLRSRWPCPEPTSPMALCLRGMRTRRYKTAPSGRSVAQPGSALRSGRGVVGSNPATPTSFPLWER